MACFMKFNISIDFYRKKLYVSIFNDKKSMDVFDTWIYFENIQSADVIDFSSYDVPDDLISKIEKRQQEF